MLLCYPADALYPARGRLLFMQQDNLFGVEFDPLRFEARGEASSGIEAKLLPGEEPGADGPPAFQELNTAASDICHSVELVSGRAAALSKRWPSALAFG